MITRQDIDPKELKAWTNDLEIIAEGYVPKRDCYIIAAKQVDDRSGRKGEESFFVLRFFKTDGNKWYCSADAHYVSLEKLIKFFMKEMGVVETEVV